MRKKVQMARVAGRLERLCRGLPGIRIEHKTASVAVHYRLAPAWARKAAAHAVQQVFASGRGLRRMDGKKIWELLPASRRDKWDAVSRIVRHEGRAARRGPNLVVYLGDDTTDEDVFHRLRGFTVAVGKRQGTAARYYLESPTEVRRFLERWNRLLS
jgi:trehalose-phosphatase